MAQIHGRYDVIVFAFDSTGLVQALEEAADVLRQQPEEFDTKAASLGFGVNGHEITLPRKKPTY